MDASFLDRRRLRLVSRPPRLRKAGRTASLSQLRKLQRDPPGVSIAVAVAIAIPLKLAQGSASALLGASSSLDEISRQGRPRAPAPPSPWVRQRIAWLLKRRRRRRASGETGRDPEYSRRAPIPLSHCASNRPNFLVQIRPAPEMRGGPPPPSGGFWPFGPEAISLLQHRRRRPSAEHWRRRRSTRTVAVENRETHR